MTSINNANSDPRFEPDSVKAVVFDIGGVFTYPHYLRVEQKLLDLGLDTPEDPITYRRAHHGGVRALSKAAVPTDEASPDFWKIYDAAYATALDVAEAHHGKLRVAIRTSWDWIHEENVASFHRLAATGMPVAIVSNNDGTAPEQMSNFGVCQVGPGPLPQVAAIVDSGIIGISKPDPAIFTPALTALDLDPGVVLYVGDTVHADVAGATNAGMQVVQLDPFDHHTNYDHHRVADVAGVIEALALK